VAYEIEEPRLPRRRAHVGEEIVAIGFKAAKIEGGEALQQIRGRHGTIRAWKAEADRASTSKAPLREPGLTSVDVSFAAAPKRPWRRKTVN
jgi:hypothetical protein